MSNESDVVVVNVSLAGGGVTRAGFGTGLLLSNTGAAWATSELTRSYDKDSFSTDFPSTTAEYAALTEFFSQPIKPRSVLVGKGPTKPTMVRTIGSITAVNSTPYKVNVVNGGVAWSASYTSDSSATIAEIIAGLTTALGGTAWQINHVYVVGDRATNDTGKLYEVTIGGTSAGAGGPTGTGSAIVDNTVTWKYIVTPNFLAVNTASTTVTCTGTAAGNWFALEPIASGDTAAVSNLMALTDTSTDPGIAGDLDAILSANPAWYSLMLLFKSAAIVSTASTGASAWCEAHERLFLISSSDTAAATTAFPGADVLDVLADAGGTYTAGMFHPRDPEWFDASKNGYFLPLEPGSDNWRLKTYGGVSACNFTGTQKTNLINRRAAFYYVLGSKPVDGGLGQVESTTYGFIDNRRNVDWFRINLQDDLIDLLITNNKIANTNAGRRQIATVIASRCDAGIAAGIISPDPLDPTNAQAPIMEPYVVFVPPVSDSTSFNTGTRALSGVTARFKFAGAINSITVNVTIAQ